MIQKTECNSLIVLIMENDDANADVHSKNDALMSIYEKYLYDPDLIKKLSLKGMQPSIEVLAKNFMVCSKDR